MTKELDIPREEYSSMFWKFLGKKANVLGRMRGAANATGLLMSNPRQIGNFQGNNIDLEAESTDGQLRN